MNLKTIFGKRIIKTAFATAIAIAIGNLIDLSTPLMAGISAIVSMTSSVFDSYSISFNRMIGTIIGGLIACFFHFIGYKGEISIALGIIVIINLCNYLNWKKAITLACIVFIIIMLYDPLGGINYYQYAFNRVLDTFVGLIIGFFTNYIIFPPKRSEFLLDYYLDTFKHLKSFFYKLLTKTAVKDIDDVMRDLNEIHTEIASIKNENKLRVRQNAHINDIIHINMKFFTIFGILIEIFEDNQYPELSLENQKRLNKFFGRSIQYEPEDCTEEFTDIFNQRIEKVIDLFDKVNHQVNSYRKELHHEN